MYQRWMEGEDISKVPKEEDPFWEPPEDVLIGTANVFLQSLAYALDFNDKLSITDYKVELSLIISEFDLYFADTCLGWGMGTNLTL